MTGEILVCLVINAEVLKDGKNLADRLMRYGDSAAKYFGVEITPPAAETHTVTLNVGEGSLIVGTSTSGLFMKEPGRVGDSPIIGSGFYADARYGAAAATGLGEDIMRGCLSYEIVSLMKRGLSPREACEEALRGLVERKLALGEDEGSISLIAMNPRGEYGAATTLRIFPFVAGNNGEVRLHAARKDRQFGAVSADEVAGEP